MAVLPFWAACHCIRRRLALAAARPFSIDVAKRRSSISLEHPSSTAISATVQPKPANVSTLLRSISVFGLPISSCLPDHPGFPGKPDFGLLGWSPDHGDHPGSPDRPVLAGWGG